MIARDLDQHDSIIKALRQAGPRGLAATDLKKVRGNPATLKALKADGTIRGPMKIGRSQRYFVADQAPTREQVEARIEARLRDAGLKLTSFSTLEDVAKFGPKVFFKDALSALKADGKIVELRDPRKSKFYLHREPLLEQLRTEQSVGEAAPGPDTDQPSISLDQVRPVYEALKAQQGGISAVTIYDVLKRIGGGKDTLHRLLLEEAKRGHVTLHPASTVNFSPEVMDAGIRLEGQPYPFVTFVLKS
jgi:hypothetical protein